MKQQILKLMILLVFAAIISGCVDTNEEMSISQKELSGSLKLDGSTTIYPIAVAAAKEFEEQHPGVEIQVDQSSSGEGIVTFLAGETDISDATRPPKDSEYEEGEKKGINLHLTIISNDAVGIIVHPSNPLDDLTVEQIKGIYFDGTITDWSQITDDEMTGKINIYNTDPEISGTAELFNKKIAGSGGAPYVAGTTIIHPTPKMIPTIVNDPNGIAYIPINWIDDSVKSVKINGVSPSKETVLDTSYLLSRKMFMITDGAPKGLERDFINFILSDRGQEIVEEEGFISVI